jgi:hypothetical protein
VITSIAPFGLCFIGGPLIWTVRVATATFVVGTAANHNNQEMLEKQLNIVKPIAASLKEAKRFLELAETDLNGEFAKVNDLVLHTFTI